MSPTDTALMRFLTNVDKASKLKPRAVGYSTWFRMPIGDAVVVAAEIAAIMNHVIELEHERESTVIAADGGSLR